MHIPLLLPGLVYSSNILCFSCIDVGGRLVDEYADSTVSWFAVGCYYTCIGEHDVARRYFGKCTAMDASFAPAWIAFGNSFAALDESDQV